MALDKDAANVGTGLVGAPATRTNPKQFPAGIDYVIVNGEIVVEGGRHTGALPGRALRRGRLPRTG